MRIPDYLKAVLTAGLKNGFVGGKKPDNGTVAGVDVKSLAFNLGDGTLYADKWVVPGSSKNSAGQEIASVKGYGITRLYAGGHISTVELSLLGITEGDVSNFLAEMLTEMGDKTRLDKPAFAHRDKWTYSYRLTRNGGKIPIIVGFEVIEYNRTKVFEHVIVVTVL